jgi:hypothetical protein
MVIRDSPVGNDAITESQAAHDLCTGLFTPRENADGAAPTARIARARVTGGKFMSLQRRLHRFRTAARVSPSRHRPGPPAGRSDSGNFRCVSALDARLRRMPAARSPTARPTQIGAASMMQQHRSADGNVLRSTDATREPVALHSAASLSGMHSIRSACGFGERPRRMALLPVPCNRRIFTYFSDIVLWRARSIGGPVSLALPARAPLPIWLAGSPRLSLQPNVPAAHRDGSIPSHHERTDCHAFFHFQVGEAR